jgi:hypothetical protein
MTSPSEPPPVRCAVVSDANVVRFGPDDECRQLFERTLSLFYGAKLAFSIERPQHTDLSGGLTNLEFDVQESS